MRNTLFFTALFVTAVSAFAQNVRRVNSADDLRIFTQTVQETMAIMNAVEFEMNPAVKPELDRVNRQAAVLRNVQVRSSNVVLSENFNATSGVALPAGWVRTPETAVFAMSRWITTTGVNLGGGSTITAREGRSAMFITSFPHPGTEGWLVSSGMDLTAGVEYMLTFNIAGYNDGEGNFERLDVILANNNSMPMAGGTTVFQSNAATFPTASAVWQAVSVNFTAESTGTHYLGFHINNPENTGWFLGIDDIVVTAVLPNDLAISSVFRYTHIPTSQIIPPLSANISNIGTATQTNVVFSAELNGTNIGTATPVASLAPNVSEDLIITPAVNAVLGSNTLVYAVSSAEGAEDSATFTFTGTENFFAQDIGGAGWNLGHIAPVSLGNIFTVTTETQLNQVQIVFNASVDNTAAYSVSIFRMDEGLPQLPALFTSPAANRTATGGTVNVDIYEILTPGSYFVAVNQLENTTFAIGAATDPDRTGYFLLGETFGSIKAGFVNPNIGPVRLRLITNFVCDPITAFPWFEDFRNGILVCWMNIDADGDGHSWQNYAFGATNMVVSHSFDNSALSSLTPDNWLITPQLVLGENKHTLSFMAATLDELFPFERYSVLVSTTDTELSSFTAIHTATLTAANVLAAGGKKVTLDLSAFSGESIYIAFRHWGSTDNFAMVLFNISVDFDLDVVSLSPANEATDVALDANVQVTFNKDITAGNLSGIIFSPAVTGVSASVNGAVLSITHDGFAYNTEYTVTIPAGAIVGFDEVITWKFTTEEGTGLPTNELANIQIYPNPVGNEMYIQTEQNITRIVVLDMQGRVVLQQQGGSSTVNMQSVASGIYTVQIHTEAGVVPIRIVKQ